MPHKVLTHLKRSTDSCFIYTFSVENNYQRASVRGGRRGVHNLCSPVLFTLVEQGREFNPLIAKLFIHTQTTRCSIDIFSFFLSVFFDFFSIFLLEINKQKSTEKRRYIYRYMFRICSSKRCIMPVQQNCLGRRLREISSIFFHIKQVRICLCVCMNTFISETSRAATTKFVDSMSFNITQIIMTLIPMLHPLLSR